MNQSRILIALVGVVAVVGTNALGIGVGLLTAILVLVAAASHLDSLSTECDDSALGTERCDTN